MGAPDKTEANSNFMQRVKVYRLNGEGKWDDQGTGHVTVDYVERSEDMGLYVIDEEDNETLLLHRISSEDIYRKQEDTIISWRDPQYATELALSFQEATGCSYIWDHICNVQRSMHFNNISNDTFHSINSELRELPAVELSTLPQILKIVVESGIADQMRLTELILNDQDFFRKLVDVFKICEDLENTEGLHMIYKIVKGIVLLNSPQIFDKMFSDDYIIDIIGALEYDPEASQVQHHRCFLKDHVVFKEAIPINDPLVLSKIHQTYRVGFLKDVVLARVLDEATIASLNSIIHANNASVVSLLKDDSAFIQELFSRLKSPTTSEESRKHLVYFLHEFCTLSKSLQMVQQLRLFRDLTNEGIFDIVTVVLMSQDKKLVLIGTDILILFLNQDPNLLRSYVVRPEGIPLLGLLVKGMITDFGENMHCQFLEILRCLLDSYTLSGTQRDSIIEIFYEKHLAQLIDVVIKSCPSESTVQSTHESVDPGLKTKRQSGTKPEILANICELLCFCVLHHPYRIKCNFLLNNVIDKVLLLTRRREKYLVVAAVRFFRTILARHDEHVVNHIVRNNVLKPIVDAFVANGNRYNLLNSAILDLFEYIRKENLKPLIKYIVDTFWNQLEKFESLASIHSLKVKYDQCLETCGTKGSVNVLESRKRVDERALEKEEEDYFNEESDEEDTASASMSNTQKVQSQPALSNGAATGHPPPSPRTGGLVDYDDDEDDGPPIITRQADNRDDDELPLPSPIRKSSESTDDDEGALESLRLKRKLPSKEGPDLTKRQRLVKNSKSKDNVFASLCSTLSKAVLPSKKPTNSADTPSSADGDKNSVVNQEKEPDVTRVSDNSCNSNEENHKSVEPTSSRSCADCLHGNTENRQLSGEDSSVLPPKSSPEMTVNGS